MLTRMDKDVLIWMEMGSYNVISFKNGSYRSHFRGVWVHRGWMDFIGRGWLFVERILAEEDS